MTQSGPTYESLREQAANFIRVELDLGLTFSRIALQKTSDSDKTSRNRVNARKAYDTATGRMEDATLTATETREFRAKRTELQARLQALGETV